MKLERPIPRPDSWPPLPPRLREKLQTYLERTESIEIYVSVGARRRERVNAIHMEEGEVAEILELTEAERIKVLERVGSLIVACTHAHAFELGRSGKYRAGLVRKVGETERRWATFPVDLESEVERRQRKGIRRSRSGNPWVNIVEANQALAEIMVRFNDRVMKQLEELRRIRQTREDQAMMRALLCDLDEVCEEGLRMQAEAAREVTEQRIEERLARTRAQVGEQLWESLIPLLDVAVAWIRQRFEHAQGSEGPAPSRAEESEAERTEGASPSVGDAPPAGKASSGA